MSNEQKTEKVKKPIFKKWWFWALIILIGLGAVGGGSKNNPTQSTSSQSDANISTETEVKKDDSAMKEEPVDDGKIKNGTYKIGTDLPSGEYLFIASGAGYIQLSSDSSGDINSIICNDMVSGHTYITVNDGEYLKLQSGNAYPLDKAPSIIPEDGIYKDGKYRVGTDIPAGEYKVISTSDTAYIEVATGNRGNIDDIVTNDLVQGDTYITVEDGQYLKLQGAEIPTK